MNYNIRGFVEVSFLDWVGAVCSIIFLPNCNFRCPYCHNAELVLHPNKLPRIPEAHVFSRLRKQKKWIEGVVVTGGEPTLSPALPDLLRSLHKYGLKVKLDTNGSRPDVLKELVKDKLIDYAVMDVKAPLEQARMDAVTGIDAALNSIAESIGFVRTCGLPHQFRTTFCPKFLTFEDLDQIGEAIRGADVWTLQNFKNKNTLDSSLANVEPIDGEELLALRPRLERFVKRLQIIA
ncbi:MAG: anaerobic ribonucleoside-triphosphate reductase activating protein [Candidatus Coatesbacteria bacterium]|nr:anaerobic ribonucleoside-triphosphate reductase activating protein [Candidatus Coatesbacteria bacterium]